MVKLHTLIMVQLTIGWQETIHTQYYNEYVKSQHNSSKSEQENKSIDSSYTVAS